MKTVEEIVQYVSGQLQDQRHREQYTRWTREVLLGYLNDAIAVISGLKPELFRVRQEVELVPGFAQTIPANAVAVVRVESNADGSPVYPADAELMRIVPTPACRKLKYTPDGRIIFSVRSFSVESTDPKTYYVSPAVPLGAHPKVILTVVKTPPTYTLMQFGAFVELDPVGYPLIQDYMMARAYERDSESAESKSNSVAHFTKFYQFFGIVYKSQSAFRSGTYQGRTEAGAPAATT